MWWYVLVTLTLGKQTQDNHGGWLASPSSLVGDFQTGEGGPVTKDISKGWQRMTPRVVFWPLLTYSHTYIHVCAHTHMNTQINK